MGIIVEKTDDNGLNKEEDNRESVAVAKHSKYEWMFPTFEVTKTHKTVCKYLLHDTIKMGIFGD